MAEPLVMQIPLDPFVTLGLMTLACAGMGWLVGPSIGNQVFYLLNHRYKAQMIQKEVEFFARVKKNRVDPSNSSAGNPGTMPPWSMDGLLLTFHSARLLRRENPERVRI